MHKFVFKYLDPDTGSEGSDTQSAETNNNQETQVQPAQSEPAPEPDNSALLKSLGVDSIDDLKAIVEAKSKADEANLSNLEKAKNNLEKSNKALSEATTHAQQLAAENAVLKAGVGASHAKDAMILAQAYVDNGTAKDLDKAIKVVVKSNPSFVGGGVGKDGTAIVDNNLNAQNQPEISQEDFNKMGYMDRNELYKQDPDLYKKLVRG